MKILKKKFKNENLGVKISKYVIKNVNTAYLHNALFLWSKYQGGYHFQGRKWV